jgi:protein gp37
MILLDVHGFLLVGTICEEENKMGYTTGIEWTNRTHNFWYGCKKVSQGCAHCYAEREMMKFGRDFKAVTRAKGFDKPLSWKESAKVFVNSWSDFFIEEADPWRAEAWDIIRRTPHLTYQILTKRTENILDRLPKDWGTGWPNVWLGMSAEDQANADKRIPRLFDIPAAVRFISAEPLLGPIDLDMAYYVPDWVIVGGESGPNCRPMNPDWARSIRDQCEEAGVAFFYKQSGGWPNKHGIIPEDLNIRQFP